MHIAVLCATKRGEACLRKIAELLPTAELTVVTFQESPQEPPFFDRIRDLAAHFGARFFEWSDPLTPGLQSCLASGNVDLMLAINWRFLLAPSIYRSARFGTFVIHDSLLPKYRGFSPTVWAMINGESETGATLFEITEKFDSGDIVDQLAVPIGREDTIASVMERVEKAYLELLEHNLHRLIDGSVEKRPQDHTLATYVRKRRPKDNEIDWSAPAESICNLIRAVGRPYAGAYTFLDGKKLRIWRCVRLAEPRNQFDPGRVVDLEPDGSAVVSAKDGVLVINDVQFDEGPVVSAAQLLARGTRLLPLRQQP